MAAVDPVNQEPIPPLLDSYTFHSTLPESAHPASQENKDGWVMGIDEAGRGPVLGPMVYACAFCPIAFKPTLEGIGFDDSKALSADTRQALWESFDANPDLCYSSTTLSPQSISSNMLRRVPVNLNRQAEEATMGLIRAALDRGINVTECFVDALGPAQQWQDRLSSAFPTVKFLVCPKADSLFKIVGAASIIAKVTRDRYIEHWSDPEGPIAGDEAVVRGSGYPSDPKTQAYLRGSIDRVFGYRGMVRFSWATVKVLLEKEASSCTWADDVSTTQPSAASYFGDSADTGRPKLWRDVGISAVGEL